MYTWTPANDGSQIRLMLPTWDHAGHGTSIICIAPDNAGMLTVPAEMVDYYLAAGAVEERVYRLSRFNRVVEDLGNGYGVALETTASQFCDFFHP